MIGGSLIESFIYWILLILLSFGLIFGVGEFAARHFDFDSWIFGTAQPCITQQNSITCSNE